jgi:hypothetical protein
MHGPRRGAAGTPFPFEGPVPPELLINREDELEVLGRRAADRVSVRLVAPRRYGKTSLLIAHAARLRAVGWRTAHVDLAQVADLVDVARRFAAAYAELDSSWVRAQLGGLLSRIGLSVSATGPAVTLGPRPAPAASEAAEAVLLPLLELPKTLWERDQTPTLVVLDEFQDLLVARKGIDGLLRSRIQYHGDAVAYVYAGSEPSLMRELFDARERPLFGQAVPLTLDPLPFDAAISDLSSRFAAERLDPGQALGELVALAAGHPQRTMLLCYLLAEALSAGQTATPALAADIVEQAVQMTAPSHQAIWQASGATERAVLAAVADGVAPTSRALAAEHNVARTTLGAAADRLVDQGHLIRSPRASRLVDPLLGEWLRRR